MNKRAYRNGLLCAVIGAAVTLVGDFLLGANPAATVSTDSLMLNMFADAVGNSDFRMVLGGLLGAFAIPLTGMGYYQISQLLKDRPGFMPKVYLTGAWAFTGLAGAGVHISCTVIPLLYKWIAPVDTDLALHVKFPNFETN